MQGTTLTGRVQQHVVLVHLGAGGGEVALITAQHNGKHRWRGNTSLLLQALWLVWMDWQLWTVELLLHLHHLHQAGWETSWEATTKLR